mmetsp:Transcript_64676/g.193248  ORF Transcript_64676/g.193248 Transcript_64676/m.193248 type:complete len:289 (-) Transcript_64676:213-1079(-)
MPSASIPRSPSGEAASRAATCPTFGRVSARAAAEAPRKPTRRLCSRWRCRTRRWCSCRLRACTTSDARPRSWGRRAAPRTAAVRSRLSTRTARATARAAATPRRSRAARSAAQRVRARSEGAARHQASGARRVRPIQTTALVRTTTAQTMGSTRMERVTARMTPMCSPTRALTLRASQRRVGAAPTARHAARLARASTRRCSAECSSTPSSSRTRTGWMPSAAPSSSAAARPGPRASRRRPPSPALSLPSSTTAKYGTSRAPVATASSGHAAARSTLPRRPRARGGAA